MTRKTISVLCAAFLLLLGSPATLPGEDVEQLTRVYRPKHAQPDSLANLVNTLGPLVKADPALGVVIISGRANQVSMVAETLAELDTPPSATDPKDVVVDIHIVGAFREDVDSVEVPKLVQEAIDEIRDTFPFSSYQLLETMTIRTMPGGGITSVRGYLQSADPVDYNIAIVVTDAPPPHTRGDQVELG